MPKGVGYGPKAMKAMKKKKKAGGKSKQRSLPQPKQKKTSKGRKVKS